MTRELDERENELRRKENCGNVVGVYVAKWIQLGEYVNSWIKGHAEGEILVYTAVVRGLAVTTDIATDYRKECTRRAGHLAVEYQVKNFAISQICN
jgi:hypothetical protein